MKFRLKHLELVNFRGFRGQFSIPFERPLIAIYGPVGAGKSSIAQAIEYALYGHQLEVKERIAKLADLINEDESEARVTLTLESLEGELKVTRVLKRVGDSAREAKVEVYLAGKKIASSVKEAEEKIVEILRLDEEDFTRFVLVTHRVLEGLVYGTSVKRSLTIDRLFGIDILEGIYKAIPIRKVEEILEQEKSKLSAFKELPEIISKYGSIEEAKRTLERLRREIEELRKVEEELTRRYNELIGERTSILKAFRDLESTYLKYLQVKAERELLESEISGKESDVSETSIKVELDLLKSFLTSRLEELMFVREAEELSNTVITVENIEDVAVKIYDIVRKLEETLNKFDEERENLVKTREDLQQELSRVERDIREIERRLREYEPIYREYQELVSKYGYPEQIRRQIEELKERVEVTHGEASYYISLVSVLEFILNRGVEVCPICGQKLTEEYIKIIREKLQELREKYSKQLSEIDKLRQRIGELEQVLAKLESMRGIVNEYEELSTRLKVLRESQSQIVAKLESIDKNLKLLERRAQLLRVVIDEARARIDKIDQRITLLKKIKRYRELLKQERDLEEQLRKQGLDLNRAAKIEHEINEVSRKLEQVREKLNNASIEYSRLERILSSIPAETIEELRNRVLKLEELYRKLTDIRNVLKKIQVNMREKMIEKTKDLVSNYFRLIYPYPDLSGAGIEIMIKEKLGTVTSEYVLYGIRSTGKKVPIARLSDGQRLTIALAFMLAVYVIANHNVSFIIMDEPMPYVDIAVRQAFAKLISRLLSEKLVEQLVITSQSREFIDVIIQEARNNNIPVELVEIERRETERRLNITYID